MNDYTKHIKTKKHLSNVKSYSMDHNVSISSEYRQIPANTLKYLQIPECIANTDNTNSISTICSYCNTSFKSNKNMFNHYIKACIHIPDKIKNRLTLLDLIYEQNSKGNSNKRIKK